MLIIEIAGQAWGKHICRKLNVYLFVWSTGPRSSGLGNDATEKMPSECGVDHPALLPVVPFYQYGRV